MLRACSPLQESFLDEGFILDKRIGVGQPKRIENATILVANTAMDTDKIKIYGARVRVDSMQKVSLLKFVSPLVTEACKPSRKAWAVCCLAPLVVCMSVCELSSHTELVQLAQ